MKKIVLVLWAFWSTMAAFAQGLVEIPSGIQQWLDEELAKSSKKTPLDIFSDTFFDETPARLVGYLKGYNPESDAKLGRVIVNDPIKSESHPVWVEIMPDGRFTADIPVGHPFYTRVWFNDKPSASFYIEPGMTMALILDWENEKGKAAGFQGPLAEVNRELTMLEDSVPQPDPSFVYHRGREMAPMDFQSEYTCRFQEYRKRFDDLIEKHPVSRKALHILQYEILTLYASKMLEYERLDRAADSLVEIPTEYYAFLTKLPLDNPLMMLSGQYDAFLTCLENIAPFRAVPAISVYEALPEKTLAEFLRERNRTLTPLENQIAKFHYFYFITRRLNKDQSRFMQEYSDSIAAFGKKFGQEMQAYDTLCLKSIPELPVYERSLLEWREKDKILADTLHLTPSLTYELLKVRSLRNFLSNPEVKTGDAEGFADGIQQQLTHPLLKKKAGELLAEYLNRIQKPA